MEIIKENPTEKNPYIVESYPYGFIRTKAKYWIERNKRGDRTVFQTLNPKTNNWNKPKKSTYSDLIKCYIDENNHFKTFHLSFSYGDQESLNKFMKHFENCLNKEETKKIRYFKAILETRKHVKVEIKTRKFKHKITGEVTESINVFKMNEYEEIFEEDPKEIEKKQKENSENLKKIFAYNYNKLGE